MSPRGRRRDDCVEEISEESGAEAHVEKSWACNAGLGDRAERTRATMEPLLRLCVQLCNECRSNLCGGALQELSGFHCNV
jgi:hypothetical protein